MNTLVWIGIGVIAYLLVMQILIRSNKIPDFIDTDATGSLITIHTTRGREFVNWASNSSHWSWWGTIGLIIASVLMVFSFIIVLYATIIAIFVDQANTVAQPQNALIIPGVNDFLPLSIAFELLIGLVIGLVVHEGGHAIFCRVENISIESMGVIFLAILPMGAFVEPNQESEQQASTMGRLKMYSAGVMNNFALAVVLFALLTGPLIGAIAVVDGVHIGGVVDEENNQFESGDVIVEIDGEVITSRGEYYDVVREDTSPEVSVVVDTADNGETETRTVERQVSVTRAITNNNFDLAPNTAITHVNGETVFTQAGLIEKIKLSDEYNATVTDESGETHTAPAGAFAQLVSEDSPLNNNGVPTETSVTVVEYAGERVVTEQDLRSAQQNASVGDTITIVLFYDGTYHSNEVTVTDNGVGLTNVQYGISGLVIDDFGIDIYPADFFLQQFGGGDGGELGIGGQVLFAIIAPLVSAVGSGIGYNFFGFSGVMTNFYTTTGPLSVLGTTTVFVLFNVSFWVAWVNIQLGAFNCLPAYPLDGGRIFEVFLDETGQKLGFENSQVIAQSIALAMTVLLIIAVLVILLV